MAKNPTHEQGLQLESIWLDLRRKLNGSEAQNLIENFDLVQSLATTRLPHKTIREQFILGDLFPCRIGLEPVIQMVRRGGYDKTIENPTLDRFIKAVEQKSGLCNLRLLQFFGLGIERADLLRWMQNHKCRPANFIELLAFGVQHGRKALKRSVNSLNWHNVSEYCVFAFGTHISGGLGGFFEPMIYFNVESQEMVLAAHATDNRGSFSIYDLFLVVQE